MKYYRFQVFRRESKKELNTAKKLPLIMMLSQLQHLQLPFFSYFVHCLFFHMHLFVALSWIKYKIPWKCLTRPKAARHSKYSYCHPMSCSVFYRVLRNWEGKLCFSRDTWYLNNGNSSGSLCLFCWCLLPVSLFGFYPLNCNVYYDLRITCQESLNSRDNHNPLVI